ncbi:MAG: LuxR C-terminal-related transcriptional regulator [Clostridiales Family XIII bacterium]|jgi:LuxR family maltose regulon positive regulatory protein|nr:LuxR C-terminal-related transcriptional regulator [Clostridiales Family XIII bacterium]
MHSNESPTDRLNDKIEAHGHHILLERQRIDRLLAEAIENPVVIVAAGAGYGKTRAVSAFLRGRGEAQIWMQISEGDNLKPRFWEHFCHSIQQYNEKLSGRLADIGFPSKAQMSSYIELIEDEMSPGKKYIFVVDDFHNVTDPGVLGFFREALEKQHGNVKTIVISRTEPTIDILRLIMKGKAAFITEDDLRFTKQETAALLKGLGISLPADSVADIWEDTKGWAFSVNLIGMSLMKSPARAQYARTAMKSNVFKLIDAEIFSVASGRLQRFLLRLSLIDHLSAPLVRALADDGLVSELESASSFIRYDTCQNAYRIHHLFLDFLTERQDMLTEGEKRETWRKAAEWCEENDFKIDTIAYYEKAGDYDKIVYQLYMGFPQQFPPASAEFFLRVFENAPAGAFDGALISHVTHTRILLSLNRVADAMDIANDVVKTYTALPETRETCRVLSSAYAALGIAELMLAPGADVYDFDRHFAMEEHYYRKYPFEFSGPSSNMSVSAYISMVSTTRKGALEEYVGALERSVPSASAVMNGCMSGIDSLALGELCFYKADLGMAELHTKEALAEAGKHNQYDIRNRALYYLLRIYLAQGKYANVQSVIEQLEAQREMKEYPLRQTTCDIVTSWYYGLVDAPEFIAAWLRDDFEENAFGEYLVDFANMMRAWLFYNFKRYEALLHFVRHRSGLTRVLFGKIEIKLLEALCQYQLKNRAEAFEALETAYELSLSNDLVMPFIEFGKDMRTLTAAAKKSGVCKIPGTWLGDINRRSAIYAKHLNQVITGYRKENGLDDDVRLTARESSILADLCLGLTRSEIAVRSELSINTVKSVINMLYLKLGAQNNADAIRIAVEKKLL